MKLYVEKTTWSGWDSEEIPASANFEFVVDYDSEYVVDEMEADVEENEVVHFSFVITKVREYYIEIKTSMKMINTAENNMEETEGDEYFKIELGKTVELTTPTLDEGDTYKFTLKED